MVQRSLNTENKLLLATLLTAMLASTSIYGQDGPQDVEIVGSEQIYGRSSPVSKEQQAAMSKQPLSAATDIETTSDTVKVAAPYEVRQFHEVLDELLTEFAYDVKMGQIQGLKNLAIRKVEVSESIPATYASYLELMVSERIQENSRVRLINCLPCKSKTSRLAEGKLLITSPRTNVAEMARAADQLGIEHFMDVVLVYHTSHMVLAFQVFDTKTTENTWSKTYNSETIKSRYQKMAVDFSQVAKSREGSEYKPEYRLLFGMGGGSIPNIGGDTTDSGMLNLQIRGTEKFNNRMSEFGLLLSVYVQSKSLLSEFPTTGDGDSGAANSAADAGAASSDPIPYEQAYSLTAMYAHNFVNAVENYNNIRHAVHAGAGIFLASGFFAPTIRTGWDIYFGRRFSANISGVYVTDSKILVNNEFIETKGGFGADVVLSLNY